MAELVPTGGTSKAEQEFQEKMKERMRQAMGDLMPDEVLQGIVARGIEEAFFKKQRRVRPDSYRFEYEDYPPWLVEFMEKEARAQVSAAVNKWIADNQDKIKEVLEKCFAGGFGECVMRAFGEVLRFDFEQFREQLTSKFQSLMNR